MNAEDSKQREELILNNYIGLVLQRKNFAHLRELCIQGKIEDLRIRSFCWKVTHSLP